MTVCSSRTLTSHVSAGFYISWTRLCQATCGACFAGARTPRCPERSPSCSNVFRQRCHWGGSTAAPHAAPCCDAAKRFRALPRAQRLTQPRRRGKAGTAVPPSPGPDTSSNVGEELPSLRRGLTGHPAPRPGHGCHRSRRAPPDSTQPPSTAAS